MHLVTTLKGHGVSIHQRHGKLRSQFTFKGELSSLGNDPGFTQLLTWEQRASLLESQVWLTVEFLREGELPDLVGVNPDRLKERVEGVTQWLKEKSLLHERPQQQTITGLAVLVRVPRVANQQALDADVLDIHVALNEADAGVLHQQIQIAMYERKINLRFSTTLDLRSESPTSPFPTGNEFFNNGSDGFAVSDDLNFCFENQT